MQIITYNIIVMSSFLMLNSVSSCQSNIGRVQFCYSVLMEPEGLIQVYFTCQVSETRPRSAL